MIKNKYLDWLYRRVVFWKHKTITINLSDEEKDLVKRQAKEKNMNIDQYAQYIIEESMEQGLWDEQK